MSLISPALLYFGMNEKVFQKVIVYDDIISLHNKCNIIIYNF